mmetsp:Transcript_27811/g.73467  ORF Transcript_27811/g.73467 Transcript_27811/m.73467 type:complete len:384 (-) Transcript_27811:138-1289(-)
MQYGCCSATIKRICAVWATVVGVVGLSCSVFGDSASFIWQCSSRTNILPRASPTKLANLSPRGQEHRTDRVHMCRIGNDTVNIPMNTPSFIIIGEQKCGTTSLRETLVDHPQILASTRESHFFDLRLPEQNGTLREEYICLVRKKYMNSFPDFDELLDSAHRGTGIVSFDATPSYVTFASWLPSLMRETLPWMDTLVVSLRNPTDRAFSQVAMQRSRWPPEEIDGHLMEELRRMADVGLVRIARDARSNATLYCPVNSTEDFENEALATVRQNKLARGLYEIQLRQWVKAGYTIPDRLLVLNFDNGMQNAYKLVLQHVGLPYHGDDALHSKPGRYRYRALNSTKARLDSFFRPFNFRLGPFLGQDWVGVWGSENYSLHFLCRP